MCVSKSIVVTSNVTYIMPSLTFSVLSVHKFSDDTAFYILYFFKWVWCGFLSRPAQQSGAGEP